MQSNPPVQGASSLEKIEIKPSSKVNVVGGLKSVVNVAGGKKEIISSKVEVVAASPVTVKPQPQQNIITKVEIVGGTAKQETPTIVSSHVEIRGESGSSIVTSPPIISSIVAVKQDDEPAIVLGNNIGELLYLLN